MASLFSFGEQNGAAGGSPASGATQTLGRTECNWKNIDDSTTAYSSVPIQAGGNSFTKFQFGAISGTFNQLTGGKFAHTSGTFGAGLTLRAVITSGYAAPVTGTLSSGLDITATGTIAGTGMTVLFGVNPPSATGSAYAGATGYTQYIVTQLQTTTGASPGDTATAELTFQYDES